MYSTSKMCSSGWALCFMSHYMARFTNWSAKYSELSGMSGASEDRSVDHTLSFGHFEANER